MTKSRNIENMICNSYRTIQSTTWNIFSELKGSEYIYTKNLKE